MVGRRRRRDPFPPDRGLQLRMVLTAVGTPLLVLACLAALVAVAPGKILVGVGIAAVVGAVASFHERAERPPARIAGPETEPRLHGIVDRLCVLADLPRPEIVVEEEREPNSWLVGLRRGRSRLYVTRGLLDLIEPAELEAVVAHELAHLAHRDAAVMTAVGGPGAVLLGGGRQMNGGLSGSRSASGSRPASAGCRASARRPSRVTASSRPTPARPRSRAARGRSRARCGRSPARCASCRARTCASPLHATASTCCRPSVRARVSRAACWAPIRRSRSASRAWSASSARWRPLGSPTPRRPRRGG